MTLLTRVDLVGALVVLISLACSSESGLVRHPILSDASGSTMLADSSVNVAGLAELSERLLHLKPQLRIGTLDGPPGTVFGRPIGVVETREAQVFVLDAMASEVRVFDSDGSYLHTLMTRGQGPLEIVNPVSMDMVTVNGPVGDYDRLMVGTRSSVSQFGLRRSEIVSQRTLRPPQIPLPSASCSSFARVYVRAGLRTDSGVLAAVNDSGLAIRRFGTGYAFGGELTREEMSVGPIACLPNGGVAMAFTYLPRVEAFDSSGQRMWVAVLPDFKPLSFEEELLDGDNVGFTMKFNAGGDMVQSISFVPPNALLIQVLRLGDSKPSAPTAQPILRTRTYLLSVESGHGAFLTDSIPSVIGVSGHILWTGELAAGGFPVVVGYGY